jgi:N12 class adenine-specific DNA methylase
MAASESRKLINEHFRALFFADSDRTERLVRLCGMTRLTLSPRLFDGSHLDFPSLNRIEPYHRTFGKFLVARGVPPMCLVEAISATIVLAWLAPFYVAFHGIADASIAALGVFIAILAIVVSKPMS